MSDKQTAGIGDPYWYEWSVGQLHLVRMLNPDNGIKSVTFQDSKISGWDDVVVEYEDYYHYYQIKHTQIDDSITFGDLVGKDEKGRSLLAFLVQCWKKTEANAKSKYFLFTNRRIGNNKSSVKLYGEKIQRPPLESFLKHLKNSVKKSNCLDINLIESEYRPAFEKEWLPAFDGLNGDEISQFLNSFEVQTDNSDLKQIAVELVDQIQTTFSINRSLAEEILTFLDSGLRKWTTSEWINRKVTREDVYQELGKKANEEIQYHIEPPPVPFFKSREKVLSKIETEIQNPENRIIFLSGSPGSGKTSVISQLTNHRIPSIHLRYYTFRPISPDNDMIPMDAGETVTAIRLWGDLLTQIRNFLKGNLAKYEVPVRNDFIQDPLKLRDNVIRLAPIVARLKRLDKIVICIDGIDHAARAGIDVGEDYLKTLLPPDEIPKEILFIIAGQPIDSYPRYPLWLKEDRSFVKKITIDNLEIQDIKDYCQTKNIQNSDIVAKELYRITSGNTLSVIYAVATIQKHENIIIAIQKLEENRIQDGLIAYYQSIWEKLKKQFGEQITIPVYLACFFSLTTARIKSSHFLSALHEFSYSESEWRTFLQFLSPLIVEDEDGYRVLQNDIRIFFSKIALDRPDIYKDTASRLVEIYLTNDDFCKERHTDLSRLLSKSENRARILDVINPKFILEAFICGAPLDETLEQIKVALHESLKIRSFEKLHKIVCTIFTLDQLESSLQEIDSEWKIYKPIGINIHELRVIKQEDWNVEIISEVFDHILFLFQEKEYERAKGLWNRWFSGLNIYELFIQFLDNESINEQHLTLSPNSTYLFKLLGKISIYLYIDTIIKNISQSNDSSELEKIAWANYSSGLLEEARNIGGDKVWDVVQKNAKTFFFYKDFNETLLQLMFNKKWKDLEFFLDRFDNKFFSPEYKNISYLCSLFLKKEPLIIKFEQNINELISNLSSTDVADSDFSNRYIFQSITCFIIGWQHRYKDASEVVDEVSKIIFSNRNDTRDIAGSKFLFRFSTELGQWFKEIYDDNMKTDYLFMNQVHLQKIVTTLLNFHGKIILGGPSLEKAIEFLIDIIIFSVEKSNKEFQELLTEIFKSQYSSEIVYCHYFPLIWKYFYKKGLYKLCQGLLSNIISDSGKLWQWGLGDKFSTLNELENITKDTHFHNLIKKAKNKSIWHQIGIVSHKDYSLYKEYAWLEILLENSPDGWSSEGLSLLQLSNKMNEQGDNRAHYDVEKLILFTALNTNPSAFYELYKKIVIPKFKNKHSYLALVIDDFFNKFDFTEKQVKLVWLLVCGTTYWTNYTDRKLLVSIKKKILTKFQSLYSDIEDYINTSFPLEAGLDLYIQSEKESEYKREYTLKKSCEEELDEYLTLGNDDIPRLSSIIKQIGKTHPHNFHELISQVLDYLKNLQKRSWWGYKGLERIYRSLLWLLTPAQQWIIAEDVIYQFYNVDEFVSLQSLANTLDSFCLYCNISDIEAVTSGLHRLKNMHNDWISGFNEKEQEDIPSVFNISTTNDTSFEQVAFQILVDKLKTRSSIQIEAAIQGIYNFLLLKQETYEFLNNSWENFSLDQKEYLLFCFEAIITKNSNHFKKIKSFLEISYKTEPLNHRLQAYLVYVKYHNITGADIPKFEFKKSEELQKLASLIPGTINTLEVETGNGYILHSHHLYQRKIEFLVNAGLLEDTEAYSKSLVYLDQKRQSVISEPKLSLPEDFIISMRTADDIINEVYDHNVCIGNLSDFPITLIAQCLLSNDDPLVLVNPYNLHKNVDIWPSRLDDTELNYQTVLPNILYSEIPDNCILIGGIVNIYTSKKNNYYCRYNKFIVQSKESLQSSEWSGTFNARSSFSTTVDTYEPNNLSNGFFILGGGVSKFIYMNNWLWPSYHTLNLIDWEFDPINPFVLLKNGEKVAWQEKFIGKLDVGFSYQMTPAMQRWVCYKDEFDQIKSKLPNVKIKDSWSFK